MENKKLSTCNFQRPKQRLLVSICRLPLPWGTWNRYPSRELTLRLSLCLSPCQFVCLFVCAEGGQPQIENNFSYANSAPKREAQKLNCKRNVKSEKWKAAKMLNGKWKIFFSSFGVAFVKHQVRQQASEHSSHNNIATFKMFAQSSTTKIRLL